MKESSKTNTYLFFTSPREKIIWFCSLVILVAIILSLFVGKPFVQLLKSQELQAGIYLFGLLLIGTCIILYGLVTKPSVIEFIFVLAVVAVYILFFLRLGLPERSHLIEYSALSITIHQALLERKKQGEKIRFISLYAFGITSFIGIIDEIAQKFLPDRIFDINDILFNCFAAFMAIGVSMSLQFAKKKIRNKTSNDVQI